MFPPPTLLLTTKLYRPPADANWVARPTLFARLSEGLRRKLILLSAPPGFGKTTLVSQWIEALRLQVDDSTAGQTSSKQVAWLSLDEYDNDLSSFLRYLIAAIRTISPTACQHTLNLLQAPQLPPIDYLANTLLHDLAEINQALILVLDDYHFIAAEAIHQLLTRLIMYTPAQVYFVVVSRTEPPLSLARLRIQQQMIEIRANDLAFSALETKTFLDRTLARTPTQETVAILQEKIEGWIAGLQLATLALSGLSPRGQHDEQAFARAFKGSHRYVMDYLLEEVLARQPVSVQKFLFATGILERFSAPLAEALINGDEQRAPLAPSADTFSVIQPHLRSQKILAQLTQSNLFLIPLDEEGAWYRYHHLFRELLQHILQTRLTQERIATLHRRASHWLAAHGLIEDAVRHALAAGDGLTAAQLLEQQRHQLQNQEDFHTLQRWLAMLPDDVLHQRPALLVAKAWVANAQHQMGAIFPLTHQAETSLLTAAPTMDPAAEQALRGEIDALQAISWFWRGEGQPLLAAAQRALTRLPVNSNFVYGAATIATGMGYLLTGQPETTLRLFQKTLEHPTDQFGPLRIRMLPLVAGVQLLLGNLPQGLQAAQECLQLAATKPLAFDTGRACSFAGIIRYEWNELAAATSHFSALVELVHRAPPSSVIDALLGLALIQQVQGQPVLAQAQVDQALAVATELRWPQLQLQIQSFQARLLLLQGQVTAAARQIQTLDTNTPLITMTSLEVPQLTQARVLLALADPTSLATASGLLQTVWSAAETMHNAWRMVETLALQALLHQTQGQTEPALATLARAVTLARPGRFIRTFVDLGPALAGLLYQLAARRVEPDYLGEVLAAFPSIPGTADRAQQIRQTSQVKLIEPLTERESEILLCLHKALPNKAIAGSLHISLLTVKRHTTNIYQKLGVETRKQAVARARALGILPADGG